MLRTFRADLHVHTCLSPCGEDEMTPLAIVTRAKMMELDVIAICDHNSTRNTAAVIEAGRRAGLAVIPGVEATSREEVHVLGLFDEQSALDAMQQLIDENLNAENNAELFGEQYICDENDTVLGREMKLLIGATDLSLEAIVANIHEFGGLAIASHVDRERFSLISQLGFVPEGLEIDALEISPRRSVTQARDEIPQIREYPLLTFSDAHRLDEIGAVYTTFTGVRPCVAELAKALTADDGREVIN